MKNISIDKNLARLVPAIQLSCIACDVHVSEINKELWKIIESKIADISASTKVEQISRIPAISDSRKAYKTCGKDPARYRLSAEALLRRVVKRKELYQINNVVDIINLVSISTGFSIGGYDAHKIEGGITFGIGQQNEAYSGIGRGDLNIEFMPVFRDQSGAFGTPTSDSVRTCVSLATKRFLMVIIDYGASNKLNEATLLAKELLQKYAQGSDFEINIINI